MKAITLWQPWASLLACGAKQYETRSWPTNYRGPIAIHAAAMRIAHVMSQVYPMALNRMHPDNALMRSLINSVRRTTGEYIGELPLGKVIAVAELVGCHQMVLRGGNRLLRESPSFIETDRGIYVPDEQELLFGDWTPGRYAWEFDNVTVLTEPVSARGMQGLWEWKEGAK